MKFTFALVRRRISNIFTIVSDIYPKNAVGSMMGLSGFAGAVGGDLSESFVGLFLDATGSYFLIFLFASTVKCSTGSSLRFSLKKLNQLDLFKLNNLLK
jgi:MFS transporter, ACS family, hexuronate transporter